jgi:hypothetical protein
MMTLFALTVASERKARRTKRSSTFVEANSNVARSSSSNNGLAPEIQFQTETPAGIWALRALAREVRRN